jgi:hypothetical protein
MMNRESNSRERARQLEKNDNDDNKKRSKEIYMYKHITKTPRAHTLAKCAEAAFGSGTADTSSAPQTEGGRGKAKS